MNKGKGQLLYTLHTKLTVTKKSVWLKLGMESRYREAVIFLFMEGQCTHQYLKNI